ncbi:MAG: extracellular solute-binding protein, partial [Chloroflexi bacterium]|nr:extracellular solute-binding protein [Chloroflexota bacterium]
TQAPAKPAESKPAATAAPAAKPTDAPAAKPGEAAKPAATAAPAAAKTGPASLKGTTLSVLQWASFVPAADELFKKQLVDSFGKDTGAQVNVEFVNANDLQPKIAASIQSGSGPDLVLFQYNWSHIYSDNLVDLSDIAEDVKKRTGDFFPQLESAAKVDGKYLSMPHHQVPNAIHWRKSWFKEAGVEKFPATFEELFEVGKKLKANGHPLGQALSQSFGDPPTWSYPMLWAYGGQEVDQGGKVVINSPETIAAVKAMKDAWASSFDETGLGWDDSSNNRAFLAETISACVNGASIWWAARDQKVPFFDDIALDLMPAGPKGKSLFLLNHNYAIMKYSKNVDAAKEFLRWSMTDEVWMPWFEFNGSFVGGVGPKQDDNPVWEKFPPVARVFKGSAANSRNPGFAGPYSQKAGLAQSKFVVVNMFAEAVKGTAPEAAVAQAENELKQIYT